MGDGTSYTFSYATESYRSEPADVYAGETVPLGIFAHASTMHALARYLVDTRGHGYSAAARLVGRSPKSLWASYHQAPPLPEIRGETLAVPLGIFVGRPALEALVVWLRGQGLRNIDIARALGLSPKTTHTVATRAGVRR